MDVIMKLPFVSILFRHLTVSQLSALRAVACGWRNRINMFFGLELFSLELTHELAGSGRYHSEDDLATFVCNLLEFIFSCCTRLRILTICSKLRASSAHILQKFRSPELQILDITIHESIDAFALPLDCLTGVGYNLRALTLDFYDAPTNLESVWETVARHCHSLDFLYHFAARAIMFEAFSVAIAK